jgi:hypothetical protein
MSVLNLKAGEIVEIKSEAEILATLDERGALEALPFMPEMLAFCGKRVRVHKRADKACDTIQWQTFRRMDNAVHLEGLRCDGSAHGGCQAGCLLYWKEDWLRRVSDTSPPATIDEPGQGGSATRETLVAATRVGGGGAGDESDQLFSCQATELLRASTGSLPWWKPGQYIRDVRSGNAGVLKVARGLVVALFNRFQKANARLFPGVRLIHGGSTYPFLTARANGRVTSEPLNLRPGELVEVRSRDEIERTLNKKESLRGLRFDREMLSYCGRRGRVLRRVEKLIDESSGRMIRINSDCIVIDGFICTGDYHRSCPRSIYPYWREAWLKRVPG